MIPSLPLRVLTQRPRGDSCRKCGLVLLELNGIVSAALRISLNDKPVARYNEGRSNKSLDASGASGLLIQDLSVAQSSAAASTQPLSRFALNHNAATES